MREVLGKWINCVAQFYLQIIDLENSIRNHNNRIEDLEVEKLQLESKVVALRETVKESLASEQLQAVTSHRNQLEIEVNFNGFSGKGKAHQKSVDTFLPQCANQKTTISNLKDALENLKRESVSQSSSNSNHHQQHRTLWQFWRNNLHDV